MCQIKKKILMNNKYYKQPKFVSIRLKESIVKNKHHR